MKFNYIPKAAPGQRWQGTQADAKRIGGKDYEVREVPTDKPNLMAFLNARDMQDCPPAAGPVEGPASTHGQPLDDLQKAELRAVAEARATTMSPPAPPGAQLTAGQVIEFILDIATVAQAESIFAALGTRFKEATNGAG